VLVLSSLYLSRFSLGHYTSGEEGRPARCPANTFDAVARSSGGFVVKCALKLVSLTFVRSPELRDARWEEFQLQGKEPTWRIPAEKMKMEGEPHIGRGGTQRCERTWIPTSIGM